MIELVVDTLQAVNQCYLDFGVVLFPKRKFI
jgi:hypothetical protein